MKTVRTFLYLVGISLGLYFIVPETPKTEEIVSATSTPQPPASPLASKLPPRASFTPNPTPSPTPTPIPPVIASQTPSPQTPSPTPSFPPPTYLPSPSPSATPLPPTIENIVLGDYSSNTWTFYVYGKKPEDGQNISFEFVQLFSADFVNGWNYTLVDNEYQITEQYSDDIYKNLIIQRTSQLPPRSDAPSIRSLAVRFFNGGSHTDFRLHVGSDGNVQGLSWDPITLDY